MKQRAFTLIELLTVITIIAILSAILIPVIGAMREKSRTAMCESNLRQIGLAFSTYQTDHKGYWPAIGDQTGGPTVVTPWFKSDLFLYLSGGIPFESYGFVKKGNAAGVAPYNNSPLYCPEVDPSSFDKPYGVNAWVWRGQFQKPISALSVAKPAQTMLAADKIGAVFSYIDGPTSTNPNTQAGLSGRHSGSTNVLYCDGHVESLNYNDILKNHQQITDPFWGW